MKIFYIVKLGLRNILAHKLRSALTITGITIGVGFIIFLVSLGFGLQRISTKQVANIEALQIIDVSPGKSKIIQINDESLEKFQKTANVDQVKPQVNIVGNLSFGTSAIEGVVYGKDREFLDLEGAELEIGLPYQNNSEKSILVNRTVLNQLGIRDPKNVLGQKIKVKMVIPSDQLAEGASSKAVEDTFVVVGVLKNESSPYVYVPFQYFRDLGVKKYSSAKVRVLDKKYTDQVKKQLEYMGYRAVSLKNTVDQINQFFTIFQLVLLSFGMIAIFIAALGMFNTLTISLLEKTREISFMKVLGTSSRDIWKLFIVESILIGFCGAFFGVLSGLSVGYGLNNLLITMAEKTGNKPVELFYAPIEYVSLIFFATIFVSFLTGIYPSFRGSKIDPLEALRYE